MIGIDRMADSVPKLGDNCMETLDRDFILQLKDCFVEFIDSELEVFHLENFIMDTLILFLKLSVSRKFQSYTYQERNQQFELVD